MGRIRHVKPELARHEGLYDLEQETGLPMRFAWVMLFSACDREGRFRWRSRALKSEVLPLDDVDFSRVLDAWLTRGLIVKYRCARDWFGLIPTWRKHQRVNARERASDLPSIEQADEVIDHRDQEVIDASSTRDPPVDDPCTTTHVHARGDRDRGRGRGSVDPPSGRINGRPAAADPKSQIWTMARTVLGDDAGPLIGKMVKLHGIHVVARIVADMAADPKADPRSYFVAACQGGGPVADDGRREYAD